MRLIDLIRRGGPQQSSNGANTSGHTPPPQTQRNRNDFSGRAAAEVQQPFKDGEKFNCDTHGKVSLHVVRRRYLTAINSQRIPRDKKVFLLVHCLKGPAEEFYYPHISDSVTELGEAFEKLDKKVNTLLNQLHTRNYLNNMTFESVKREQNCSDMEAFELIYQRIINLTPQVRKTYIIEDAKVDMLYHITKGHPCSRTVLANQMAQSETSSEE